MRELSARKWRMWPSVSQLFVECWVRSTSVNGIKKYYEDFLSLYKNLRKQWKNITSSMIIKICIQQHPIPAQTIVVCFANFQSDQLWIVDWHNNSTAKHESAIMFFSSGWWKNYEKSLAQKRKISKIKGTKARPSKPCHQDDTDTELARVWLSQKAAEARTNDKVFFLFCSRSKVIMVVKMELKSSSIP